MKRRGNTLSPWAFESQLNEKSDLVFGGELHKSVVLKFIEDLAYVDFVNDFNMYHLYQNGRIKERFQTGLDSDDDYYATSEPDGACDIIKMVIHTNNPDELTILTKLKVRFLKGVIANENLDALFIEELQNAIKNRHERGVVITKTLLRTLIKNIYYIDTLIDIVFYKVLPEDHVLEDVDVAIAKTSRSIVVTAEQHRIGVYRSGDHQCEGSPVIGIGFMIVEADFVIPSPSETN